MTRAELNMNPMMMVMSLCKYWWIIFWVFDAVVDGEKDIHHPHDAKKNDWLRDFVYERSGGNKGIAVWSYEGQFVDPRTGHVISRVEGLELVRRLVDYESSSSLDDRQAKERWNQLSAQDILLLKNQKEDEDDDNDVYAGTLLSRKLFCHLDPENDKQNTILQRIRPFGNPSRPWKYIPPSQAISVQDTAITYLTSTNANDTNTENNQKTQKMPSKRSTISLHTEWPNGSHVTSHATLHKPPQSEKLEFAVQLPQRISKRRPVQTLLPPSSSNKKSLTNRIPRSKWIQLGKSSSTPGNDTPMLLPARETYMYQWESTSPTDLNKKNRNFLKWLQNNVPFSNRNSDDDDEEEEEVNEEGKKKMTLYYTRQGEAPPWYGPGQSVLLELKGTRHASLEDAPYNTVARLAARNVPGFATVLTPLADNDTMAAKRAVTWFRQGDKKLPLQVIFDEFNDHESHPYSKLRRSSEQWLHRIMAATKLTSGTKIK